MSSEWSDDAVEHSKAVEDAKAVLVCDLVLVGGARLVMSQFSPCLPFTCQRAIDPGSDDVQAGPVCCESVPIFSFFSLL